MRRPAAFLLLVTLLAIAPVAPGRAGVSVRLGAGGGFPGPADQHYVQLETASYAFSLGLYQSVLPWLGGTIEADWFHYGQHPSGVEAAIVHHHRLSNIAMALVGLELRTPMADGSGFYVTGGLGLARIAIGDEVRGDSVVKGDRVFAPALGIGAGIRTPRFARGPRLDLGVRSMQAHLSGPNASVVALMAALEF